MKAIQDVRTKIPLAKPVFTKEMEDAAINALRNEHFVSGESVKKFEEEFAAFCGVNFAVSTNSGTDALQVALLALGVSEHQNVITTPASFIATSNSVLHVGAVPSFADIDIKTNTLDPALVEGAITEKTRAILPVHLYGYPANMDSINKIARERGIFVVEDACQAHGAFYKGRRVGGLGDAACFSFYPSKNMTVGGDGGMVVTNDEKVAEKVAKLRDCGRKDRYVHEMIGYTARLNTVNAAIGRVQLKYLTSWNESRRRNAEIYTRSLSDIEGLVLPPEEESGTEAVYHLYVIRTKHRDSLKQWLESQGVQCGIHYPVPIHLQPIYREMFGFSEGMFLRTEELSKTCLSIPMYPDMDRGDIEFVSGKIHEFFETERGGGGKQI